MIFDWLSLETAQLLLRGLLLTIALTAVTSLLSLAVGVAVGTLRFLQRRWMWWMATAFIEIHRNVPALLLIIFWAFALPNLLPEASRRAIFFDNWLMNGVGEVTGLAIPYYLLASVLALTLNTGAYLAELFRAGIGTIPQEHVDAARSLGASRRAVFGLIILPQGLRAAFPAISTRLIHNMKNTALVALVSTPEFFHNTQAAISRSFRAAELLLLAAAVYLALSLAFATLLRWVERRLDRRPPLKRGSRGSVVAPGSVQT
jgi:His/Glu/Gln/Arg/opine family amino acid ABC transporter permease subunit